MFGKGKVKFLQIKNPFGFGKSKGGCYCSIFFVFACVFVAEDFASAEATRGLSDRPLDPFGAHPSMLLIAILKNPVSNHQQ